jgi:hypothetical protein
MRQIIDAARALGWEVFHAFDSRRSAPGYPDLCMVRGLCVLFYEVKSAGGRVTPEQQTWLRKLGQAKYIGARVVRPEDWDDVLRELESAVR